MLWIRDPRLSAAQRAKPSYPTVDTLAGKTLAIFNNSWTCMDEIAQWLGNTMAKRYGVKAVLNFPVPIASAVDKALLDEAARTADFAVVGLAN
jgi:hypothetical protein